jgi:UDP-N-acetylmuramate: L-alanyl-gamma-D-glutamyl-meso-diaminopimelate ligase
MGVGGTAMAALAGMLHDAGYQVTGSDGNKVYPPMSTYLEGLGIQVMEGYRAQNLAHRPDLVVVGNVIRQSYDEAQALLASERPYMSFPALLGAAFIQGRRSIVVAGTHGKTTTTSLAAWLLEAAGLSPGFLIGGLARNFDRTARRGGGPHFVVEGDEYDTAFFDKGPKFLHYRPTTALITSVEFDHADIYRDLAHVQDSFRRLVALVPAEGAIVARTDHETVREVLGGAAAPVVGYGRGQLWDGRVEAIDPSTGTMTFAVLHEGGLWGRFRSIMVGEHNLYNQVAVVAALSREGLSPEQLDHGFSSFAGIKRRQEVIGEPGTVTVIDDFAHHPTAVEVTLQALRQRFGGRRLWAIFEPRSNTSRRKVFQEAYASSFGAADVVVIAPPPDMGPIAAEERFDAQQLVAGVRAHGRECFLWGLGPEGALPPEAAADSIAAQVAANVLPEDVVAVLSNGGFGGLHKKLLMRIGARFHAG